MDNTGQPKEKGWNWAEHKPNNMFSINATPEKNFFKWWWTILRPFVALTPKEIDVMAALLKQRFELAKIISDPVILDSQLMGNDTRNKVLEECKITLPYYHVIISSLKKRNVITETGINSRLIPNIRKDDNNCFQLLIQISETA